MTQVTTSTTDIADLIHLLDKEALQALSARLQKVAEKHGSTEKCSGLTSDPRQLLFEFIDEGLAASEEYLDESEEDDAQKARALLAEIELESSR